MKACSSFLYCLEATCKTRSTNPTFGVQQTERAILEKLSQSSLSALAWTARPASLPLQAFADLMGTFKRADRTARGTVDTIKLKTCYAKEPSFYSLSVAQVLNRKVI